MQEDEEILMETIEGQTFENQRVVLDGVQYNGCTFKNCSLIILGGEFGLANNTITRCFWKFEGAAANTLKILQMLHAGGVSDVVEMVVADILGKAPAGTTE